jgi:hypothetical protein
MERELWKVLYVLACQLDKSWPRGLYKDCEIVGVFLWAVIHDRPTCWATDLKNWPTHWNTYMHVPSQSTMSRRLNSIGIGRLLDAMSEQYVLISNMATGWVKIVDAKPLPIGGHSKDPEAKWGHSVRGPAKGYKIFVIWGNGPMPLTWRLTPMNESETKVTQRMLPDLQGGGYLLGDSIYDSNPLYALARQYNHQLVAPRKRPGTGLGHRIHDPDRLRAMNLLQTRFGKAVMAEREHIEQQLAHLTNFGGGLAPLPNWVRRIKRVRKWVQAKFLINAVKYNQSSPNNVIAVA